MIVAVARDLERWSARTGVEITDDDVEPANRFLAAAGATVSGVAYAGRDRAHAGVVARSRARGGTTTTSS